MPSEKIVLTPDNLKKIAKRVQQGDADGEIITDLGQKNVELRVQGRKASWVLRYKGKLKTFGYLFPETDRKLTVLSEVRELRTALRSLINLAPERVEPFLSAYYGTSKRDVRAAYDAAEEMTRPAVQITTWTFKQCVENMVERRLKEGAKAQISQSYATSMEQVMKHPCLEGLLNVPACTLTRGDAEDVRDRLLVESGVSGAAKFVSMVRTTFDYSVDYHAKASGLENALPWWDRLKTTEKGKSRTRVPTLEEIGKTLALAEYYRHHRLPGRKNAPAEGRKDGKFGVRTNVFTAFLWIVFSAQRQGSGLALESKNLTPDPYREGWYIANWGPGMMKGGKAFTLPIPPLMMRTLKPYMEESKGHGKSIFAFPAEKSLDKSINRSVTLGVLKRLGGRDDIAYKHRDERRKNQPDYEPESLFDLNDIEFWVPHDIRRAIQKVMDDAGIPGGGSAILAHTIELNKADFHGKQAEWEEQASAKITEWYYANQRMALKQKAMEIWVDAVFEAWTSQKDKLVISDRLL